MTLLDNIQQRPVDDGYDRHLAEKLWMWIPEVYRVADAEAEPPDVLRALVDILAAESATGRRSTDRVWENVLIDYADDWAVPYIGDLVATVLVNALNRRGRRIDVAKTIHYRRRAGTVTVLEELVGDITGWSGVVVESFRRLGRTWHGFDPVPAGRLGAITATPPGGTADLRNARIADIIDGPFDDMAHTPDFRQLAGRKGRYNIPKLNVHLFRQDALAVRFVTPVILAARHYTLDPSGRDIPLFKPNRRDPARPGVRPLEWQVRGPFSCRLANEATFRLTATLIAALQPTWQAYLQPIYDVDIRGTGELRRRIQSLLTRPLLANPALPPIAGEPTDAHFAAIVDAAMVAQSAKRNLNPQAISLAIGPNATAAPLTPGVLYGADLSIWQVNPPPLGSVAFFDPARARVLLRSALPAANSLFVPLHHVGMFWPVGAGTYDRHDTVVPGGLALPAGAATSPGPITGFNLPASGVRDFTTSKTYRPNVPAGVQLPNVTQLRLQARDGERPYVLLRAPGAPPRYLIESAALPVAADPADPANARTLDIDGLWIGCEPPGGVPLEAVAGLDQAATPLFSVLVIDGDWDRVTIRNATLDPGGEQARVDPLQARAIPGVILELKGQIDELVIDRSVVGIVREFADAVDPGSVERVTISNSIVYAIDGSDALITRTGEVHLERCTIFGDVRVNRLYATETLVQGVVRVTDNQHGCFRFSAADAAPDMSLPPRFQSHIFEDGIPNHAFVSRRFGDPGYAQLSETAPRLLARGGEDGTEIGVYNRALAPIKADDLAAKFREFAPIQLIAQFINET